MDSSLRTAAQQALEALEWAGMNMAWNATGWAKASPAITALRAALAEPVQEPYAWMSVGGSIWRHKTREDDVPLYTAPRTPLSEAKIRKLLAESAGMTVKFSDVDLRFARAIERAHGIGGSDET